MAFVAPVLGFMPKYHNSFIHSFDFIDFSWIPYLCDIISIYIYIIRGAFYVFFSETGGGGELSLRFCLPPSWPFCVLQ